jgi:hypothetical protein
MEFNIKQYNRRSKLLLNKIKLKPFTAYNIHLSNDISIAFNH